MNEHGKHNRTMTRAQIEGGAEVGVGEERKRRPPPARLPPAVAQQINENLKQLYEAQLQQDLPDRLKDLVAQLRNSESGR